MTHELACQVPHWGLSNLWFCGALPHLQSAGWQGKPHSNSNVVNAMTSSGSNVTCWWHCGGSSDLGAKLCGTEANFAIEFCKKNKGLPLQQQCDDFHVILHWQHDVIMLLMGWRSTPAHGTFPSTTHQDTDRTWQTYLWKVFLSQWPYCTNSPNTGVQIHPIWL